MAQMGDDPLGQNRTSHILLHAQLTSSNPLGPVISVIELTVYFHYTVYKTVISSHDYRGILIKITELIFMYKPLALSH